jgi:hypothetical protein
MSVLKRPPRNQPGGWVQPNKDPEKRLCRYCGTKVPSGRYTFCSGRRAAGYAWRKRCGGLYKKRPRFSPGSGCVHEHLIRTQGDYARLCCWGRDRGVCQACGLDTDALADRLCRLLMDSGRDAYRAEVQRLGFRDGYCLWQADHIVPVCEGGGSCGLEGLRTLCWPCHKQVTALLKAKLARERKEQPVAVVHSCDGEPQRDPSRDPD